MQFLEEDIITGNPYPGLRPFRDDEYYLFFGREEEVSQMLERLSETRFLAIVGSSGSGKSSLERCGLRPAILGGSLKGASSNWYIADFRPGGRPIHHLAEALTRSGMLHTEASRVEQRLRTSKRGIIDVYMEAKPAPDKNILIVIDQFEELFRFMRRGAMSDEETRRYNQEAKAFIKLLLELRTTPDLPVYVVLTMRSDYFGECSYFLGLPEAINEGQYLVPQMTREQRMEAIQGPARMVDMEVSVPLLTLLINEVEDKPDQLPFLQHGLHQIWQRWNWEREKRGVTDKELLDYKSRHPLDLQHYYATGLSLDELSPLSDLENKDKLRKIVNAKIKTKKNQFASNFDFSYEDVHELTLLELALDIHADEALAELNEREQRVAETVFKFLTDKSEGHRGIRRPMRFGKLCDYVLEIHYDSIEQEESDAIRKEIRNTIHRIADVYRKDDRSFLMPPIESAKTLSDHDFLDISHESLMRAWTKLVIWADEEARSAQVYKDMVDTYDRKGELWATTEFGRAESWVETPSPNKLLAKNNERDNYDKAINFFERSRVKRKTNLFWRVVVPSLLILGILFAIFFGYKSRVENEKLELQAAADSARAEAAEQSRDALSVSSMAMREAESNDPQTISNAKLLARLGYALSDKDTLSKLMNDDVHDAIRTAYNLDKRLTDSERDPRTYSLPDIVRTVTFSPDGHRLAVGHDANGITLFELNDQKEVSGIFELTGHQAPVRALAFSPDSELLASGSMNGSIILWQNPGEGAQRTEIQALNGEVFSLSFVQQEGITYLASGGRDENIKVWRVEENLSLSLVSALRQNMSDLPDFAEPRSRALAFSPEGHFLAAGGSDGHIRIWSNWMDEEATLVELENIHEGEVNALAFSPRSIKDGTVWIASGAGERDQRVRYWPFNGGPVDNDRITTLPGPKAVVYDVAFSSDGKYAFAGDARRRVQMWPVDSTSVLPLVFRDESREVFSLAISPDGQFFASGGPDKTVRVWRSNPFYLAEQICPESPGDILDALSTLWRSFFNTEIEPSYVTSFGCNVDSNPGNDSS